jgi:hypothetical protein
MISQTNGINAMEGEGYRESGKSMLHDRKIHPRQETHQGLDRGKKLPTLIYDSRVSERLKQLRREIAERERRIRLYNYPISMDNFL